MYFAEFCVTALLIFHVLSSIGKVLYGPKNKPIDKKKINGGFLSSTKRFSQPRDVIYKKADVEIPGLFLSFQVHNMYRKVGRDNENRASCV